MKPAALLLILALSGLSACRKQVKPEPEAPRDYEGSKRHAEEQQKSLDRESSR